MSERRAKAVNLMKFGVVRISVVVVVMVVSLMINARENLRENEEEKNGKEGNYSENILGWPRPGQDPGF